MNVDFVTETELGVIHSFIHTEHLYSASSRELLRGAPDSSTAKKSRVMSLCLTDELWHRLWSHVVLITEVAIFWYYRLKHSETPELKTQPRATTNEQTTPVLKPVEQRICFKSELFHLFDYKILNSHQLCLSYLRTTFSQIAYLPKSTDLLLPITITIIIIMTL